MSDEDAAERKQVQEEWDSTKQCLTICAQASEHVDQVRTNVFEDVSAAQDAHQVIVAQRLEILFQPSESPLDLEPHNG